jgi:hypothetical protein
MNRRGVLRSELTKQFMLPTAGRNLIQINEKLAEGQLPKVREQNPRLDRSLQVGAAPDTRSPNLISACDWSS